MLSGRLFYADYSFPHQACLRDCVFVSCRLIFLKTEQIAKVYEKGLIVCTKGIKFFVLRAFSPEEEVDLAWIGFR
jgi:hypothetical protein